MTSGRFGKFWMFWSSGQLVVNSGITFFSLRQHGMVKLGWPSLLQLYIGWPDGMHWANKLFGSANDCVFTWRCFSQQSAKGSKVNECWARLPYWTLFYPLLIQGSLFWWQWKKCWSILSEILPRRSRAKEHPFMPKTNWRSCQQAPFWWTKHFSHSNPSSPCPLRNLIKYCSSLHIMGSPVLDITVLWAESPENGEIQCLWRWVVFIPVSMEDAICLPRHI